MAKSNYKLNNLYNKNRNLVLYCIIGASGVLLDSVIYVCLIAFGVHYQIANLIGVNAGIINNFIWNVRLNYCVTDNLTIRFLRFYSIGLLGLGLSALMLWICKDLYNLPSVIAVYIPSFFGKTTTLIGEAAVKGMVLVIVVAVQFLLNHFYSFRKENAT